LQRNTSRSNCIPPLIHRCRLANRIFLRCTAFYGNPLSGRPSSTSVYKVPNLNVQ
jgi:hypothetical protein